MSHDHDAVDPPHLDQVADGVYAYVQPDGTWFINNTGFVVGDDGVFAIDGCSTERRTRAFLDAIASVTDQPVRRLLNTHHHADHTNGNCLFGDATILAHERCREVMMATGITDYSVVFPGVDWGELTFAPPTVTFRDALRIHVGDLVVELQDLGHVAHTEGDVVAWVPERGVLFAGDLIFHGGTPFTLFGSVAGTLTAMDRLEAYGAEVLVPGHGPVARGADVGAAIQAQRDYLTFVQQTAKEGIAAGRSPLEQARTAELGVFDALTDSERLVGNLHVAYSEANGTGPVDVRAAIGQMVEYNDGQPLRCVA